MTSQEHTELLAEIHKSSQSNHTLLDTMFKLFVDMNKRLTEHIDMENGAIKRIETVIDSMPEKDLAKHKEHHDMIIKIETRRSKIVDTVLMTLVGATCTGILGVMGLGLVAYVKSQIGG